MTKITNKSFLFLLLSSFIFVFCILFKIFIIGKPKEKICQRIFYKDIKHENFTKSIPILLATNKQFSTPSIIAITSACENSKNFTKYSFYVITDDTFPDSYKQYFYSINKIYKNCEVFLVDFPKNLYKELPQKYRLPNPTFFRLFAPIFFPNIDKIIYIDGDTLILNDLTEMYNIDMTNLYVRGFLDNDIKISSKYIKDIKRYICTGITILNLKELRKIEFAKEVITFIKNNPKDSIGDQAATNILYQDHLRGFPPEFGSYNFYDKKEIIKFVSLFNETLEKNSVEEIVEAIKNPSIIHLTHSPKPWDRTYYDSSWFHKRNNDSYKNLWWDYLYKTEICSEFYDNQYMKGKKKNFSLLDYLKF